MNFFFIPPFYIKKYLRKAIDVILPKTKLYSQIMLWQHFELIIVQDLYRCIIENLFISFHFLGTYIHKST